MFLNKAPSCGEALCGGRHHGVICSPIKVIFRKDKNSLCSTSAPNDVYSLNPKITYNKRLGINPWTNSYARDNQPELVRFKNDCDFKSKYLS